MTGWQFVLKVLQFYNSPFIKRGSRMGTDGDFGSFAARPEGALGEADNDTTKQSGKRHP
jgi:hypothetical protein